MGGGPLDFQIDTGKVGGLMVLFFGLVFTAAPSVNFSADALG